MPAHAGTFCPDDQGDLFPPSVPDADYIAERLAEFDRDFPF